MYKLTKELGDTKGTICFITRSEVLYSTIMSLLIKRVSHFNKKKRIESGQVKHLTISYNPFYWTRKRKLKPLTGGCFNRRYWPVERFDIFPFRNNLLSQLLLLLAVLQLFITSFQVLAITWKTSWEKETRNLFPPIFRKSLLIFVV